MVRFEDISTEAIDNTSLHIQSGLVYKIISKSDHSKRVLLDTILGIRKPLKGRAFLFAKDIWETPNREVLSLLKHVGVVWNYGGLISNLKVWENLAMPVCYHSGTVPENLEIEILEIYKHLGRDVISSEYMAKLPGPLPINEKKLITLVREMLMQPRLIIYDALFEGFDPEMIECLSSLTMEYHSKNLDRATVYISSDQESFASIKEDVLIREDDRGLLVCQ